MAMYGMLHCPQKTVTINKLSASQPSLSLEGDPYLVLSLPRDPYLVLPYFTQSHTVKTLATVAYMT